MGGWLEGARIWLVDGAVLAGAAAVAIVAHAVVYAVAARVARRSGGPVDDFLVARSRRPARVMFPVLAAIFALQFLRMPEDVVEGIRHGLALCMVAGVAWLLVGLLDVVGDVAAARYPVDVKDNLEARRIETQFQLLKRIGTIVIGVVAVSIMLMTFPSIRHLGASLFASAGIAGLVIGMAARPALTNLLAGVQIALTQPIRLDDVLIVEGEWGRVEEIGTTYVVVRIWDLRRLVLPLTYFIEKPFQNWTRVSADLLGTTFVYADYTVPVEEVRQELHRVLESSGMWDGKVWNLQVTNADERTVELRALMSAPDASRAWDLRCHVREKLIAFLQERHPDSLPRVRANLRTATTGTGS